MLNKVKTKALISVGAVAATSFILWILHDKKNKEIKRKIKLFIDTVLRFNAMILNHSFSINQI